MSENTCALRWMKMEMSDSFLLWQGGRIVKIVKAVFADLHLRKVHKKLKGTTGASNNPI